MKQVDRKTARLAYVAGETITVFDNSVPNEERVIIVFSCHNNIKDASKVRKFNSIVKTFSDYDGTPSFWLGEPEWANIR